MNEKEIKDLQLQNINWHYNQILSKFELKYTKRLEDKSISTLEKEKILENILKIINQIIIIIIDYVF